MPGDSVNKSLQVLGLVDRQSQTVHLFPMGVAESQNYGKPPTESLRKLQAHTSLLKKQVTLISDGCKAYVPWAAAHKVKHYACKHSKQEWARAVQRGRLGTLLVHTGTIDGCWQQCKKYIPANIATQKRGEINPDLWLYMGSWQWRRCNKQASLFDLTGKTLAGL